MTQQSEEQVYRQVADLYRSSPQRFLGALFEVMGDQICQTNRDNGWYDKPCSFVERLALLHSEISEALEEYRSPHPEPFSYQEMTVGGSTIPKPIGVPSELADVLIRLLELVHVEKIDLARATVAKMSYNKTRAYRHGQKRL